MFNLEEERNEGIKTECNESERSTYITGKEERKRKKGMKRKE
jgi:hypothetical protein